MENADRMSGPIRFGTFEVDFRAGELRKNGIKLKLSGQPFQVLAILLERHGEVVSRDELQKRLWPDTFVDVDHNLNTAINKIREVLGDSSENPRFVETLPRRGYRFIAAFHSPSGDGGQVVGPKLMPAGKSRVLFPSLALVSLLGVGALLVGVYFWHKGIVADRHTAVQSLAVLPLTNLSGGSEQEYFTDGMTEALITELGKVTGPRVISRQSIMRYKGSKKSLQEIANDLSVDAVLEGAVGRSGDEVRVTVHLSEARPERQLWSKEYRRNIRDVLGLQDEIADDVAAGIQGQLRSQMGVRNHHHVDPQAQDDYLHGQYFAYRQRASDTETAIAYYQKAIAKDPGFVLPYAALSSAYMDLANPWTPGHSPREMLPLARAAGLKALQLDASLTEAHVALGWSALQDWNWQEAEREARLAVRLNPSDAPARFIYSEYLSVIGQHDEAIAEMKRAIQADPLNLDYQHELGWTFYRARQYDLAISQFLNLADDPGLAVVYIAKGKFLLAITALQEDIGRRGRRSVSLALLATAYGFSGQTEKARRLISELHKIAQHDYVSPFIFIGPYLSLGDREKSLDWVERSYESQDPWTVFFKTLPGCDPLRAEPRFQAILRRMNFPQ